MVKSQWGIKRNCSNCGTKFYDLLKFPIVCPNCNSEFDIQFEIEFRIINMKFEFIFLDLAGSLSSLS